MTEHGRKSLGLEQVILHQKTDSKDSNEITQITTKKVSPKMLRW
jgi:hypothetical protein